MKKAVCSGYYGFDNFGDDAVLKVLVEGFSKKYNLTVFSANPEKTAALYNVTSIYSFDYINVINTIKNAEVLISGGGSLLQDVTSLKSLLYYLLLIYVAILFRKEIIIFAQGMGPFKSVFSRILVKNALKQCTTITVRDEDSLKLLNNWGINAQLVCDPVFALPIPPINKIPNKVGIQLRSFDGVTSEFIKSLAKSINTHFKESDIVIYALQDSKDLEVCTQFARELKVKSVDIKRNLSLVEVIDELSSLEYLIAMRFHATLIGLKTGVKVLPIVYDPKVKKLATEAEIPYIMLSEINNIDGNLNNLKNQNTETIKNNIDKRCFDFKVFDI